MSTSIVIVRPIASPATCLKVLRGSTAVPKTTQTRKNVSTASMTTPCPAPIPPPSAGTPRCDCDSRLVREHPLEQQRRERGRAELGDPVADGEGGAIRRVTRKPSVIAGLNSPPEMKPIAQTMTPIARPFASATSVERAGERDGAGADEDQREGADELGDAPAEIVTREHGRENRDLRRTVRS